MLTSNTTSESTPDTTSSATSSPKRRGRPPKTTSKVVRQVRLLGLEHFAFVRATLMGLDLRKNFERYIA